MMLELCSASFLLFKIRATYSLEHCFIFNSVGWMVRQQSPTEPGYWLMLGFTVFHPTYEVSDSFAFGGR